MLVTIYKLFIKHYLDYGNVVYDPPSSESFHQTLELRLYCTAVAITGTSGVHHLKNLFEN